MAIPWNASQMKRVDLDKWIQKKLLRLPTEKIYLVSDEAKDLFETKVKSLQIKDATIDLICHMPDQCENLIRIILRVRRISDSTLEFLINTNDWFFNNIVSVYFDFTQFEKFKGLIKKLYLEKLNDIWVEWLFKLEGGTVFEEYKDVESLQDKILAHPDIPTETLVYILNKYPARLRNILYKIPEVFKKHKLKVAIREPNEEVNWSTKKD